jgi:TrmH RNA methyltransferase
VLAVVRARPDDIVRVAFNAQVRDEIGPLLSFASSRRLECSQVTEAEISRITESPQHDGVCVATKPRRWTTPQALGDMLVKTSGVAIAFDRVRNPYNIGAILRTAAFFGVDGAILGMPAPHPALSPQAVRVAEGGAEHLLLTRTTDLADTLSRLRARGITVVGAEDDGTANVFGYQFKRPCIVVMGHEREGLSDRVRAQCDVMVAIPGAGSVHSLNVAIAGSILIAEMQRARTA